MICVPITAATTDQALEKAALAATLADLIELRIDGMREVDLARLLRPPRPPIIVTNRRREEGGSFAGTEEERVSLLIAAARSGADYVDVETATAPALKDEVRRACAPSGTKRIASWHDFTGTPPAELLQLKLSECMADAPAIVKIVTLALDPADNLRLLALIPQARQMGLEITAFCMGEKGKFGRIAAHLLGAAISYASLEGGEASAPGQLTARQMREILRIVSPSPCPLPQGTGACRGKTTAEEEAGLS
jgi:3-dehydroquinate dehydratase type I